MPDDERVIQQPALLEVGEQAGDRAVRLAGVHGVEVLQRPVLVPRRLVVAAARVQLHHPHAALDQPPRHQRLASKETGAVLVQAVQPASGLVFLGDINRLGGVHLHVVGQLVGLDARRELVVFRVPRQVFAVQIPQQVQPFALALAADLLRRTQVNDRIAGGAELRPLVGGRHEASPPIRLAVDGAAAMICEDHVAGQVLVLRAQTVGQPTAHAGMAGQHRAGVHLVQGRTVIVGQGMHRADHREVVRVLGDLREQFRNFEAALPVLLELPRGGHQPAGIALRDDHLAHAGHHLAGVLFQLGLGVEGVDVARAPVAEDRDDTLRLGREVRHGRAVPARGRQRAIAGQHRGQPDIGQATTQDLHQLATVQGNSWCHLDSVPQLASSLPHNSQGRNSYLSSDSGRISML